MKKNLIHLTFSHNCHPLSSILHIRFNNRIRSPSGRNHYPSWHAARNPGVLLRGSLLLILPSFHPSLCWPSFHPSLCWSILLEISLDSTEGGILCQLQPGPSYCLCCPHSYSSSIHAHLLFPINVLNILKAVSFRHDFFMPLLSTHYTWTFIDTLQ